MKGGKEKAAEWCHCLECRQCDLCWPSMKSQFYPSKLQLKFCQSGQQNRGKLLEQCGFLLYLLQALQENVQRVQVCAVTRKGGHKWLRREWQACLSQEVEQGEVGTDADSSGVSSTDSWSEGSRLKKFWHCRMGRKRKILFCFQFSYLWQRIWWKER